MYDMLKNMDPPLGFGNKCPNRLAYKKLIRMNMPLDDDGKVNFTTTLFALIRENLNIKMRSGNYVSLYCKILDTLDELVIRASLIFISSSSFSNAVVPTQ